MLNHLLNIERIGAFLGWEKHLILRMIGLSPPGNLRMIGLSPPGKGTIALLDIVPLGGIICGETPKIALPFPSISPMATEFCPMRHNIKRGYSPSLSMFSEATALETTAMCC
jgi:hypothetical protein